MAVRELIIGTRGSALAIWQAEWVQNRLRELQPGLLVSLKRIKTTGDRILDSPLAMIGGKGLFVKEIEEALAGGEIDLAVHSMKDVPTSLPAGMEILSIPAREDPRDAWISRDGVPLEKLHNGARIGTSSLRRQAQVLHARPDFTVSIAAHATVDNQTIMLCGLIASVDGRRLIRGSAAGPIANARGIGVALAERLLSQGGREILKEIYEKP